MSIGKNDFIKFPVRGLTAGARRRGMRPRPGRVRGGNEKIPARDREPAGRGIDYLRRNRLSVSGSSADT